MYKTLLESYYDMYENSLFLGEFSYEELPRLTKRHIEEAVYLVATQMQQESIDVEEGLEYLTDALVDYGDVLYEEASLSFIEEQILYELVDTLKSGAKGLAKSAIHTAGYATGLGVRAAKGLWRLLGKGYNRGRYGSYEGTSRGSERYRNDPYEYESDRGFGGSSGVRAAIGQALRNRQQNQPPAQSAPDRIRVPSSTSLGPRLRARASQNRQTSTTTSQQPTQSQPTQTASPQQQRVAALGKSRKDAAAERQRRLDINRARMSSSQSTPQTGSRPIRIPAPPIPSRRTSQAPQANPPSSIRRPPSPSEIFRREASRPTTSTRRVQR